MAAALAFAGIYGRRFRAQPPLSVAAGQVCAASVLLAPLALVVERPWQLPVLEAEVLGALVGLGLFSTAAAYYLYFRILASAGATNLLLVTFLIPVSAVLLGVSILGEALSLGQLAGMALIGCGRLAVDGRLPALFGRLGTNFD